ncbi:MAG: hypothetical protein FJX62_07000 [Alphaproteobacteria bacterium]|nr:hypothetical protein [Alphaproteobacteria bacterium]
MIVGRLLIRFLLVPLGGCFAIVTFVLFVMAAHWNRFARLVEAERGSDDAFFVALVFLGASILIMAAISAAALLLPAMLGALIAESFAIRSWIFHVLNGALSAWIGWAAFSDMRRPFEFYSDPLIIAGAGIAAGFAYWAVAGWSAGFWKPVFVQPPAASPPAVRA